MSHYPDDCPQGPPEPATRFCDECGGQIEYDDEDVSFSGTQIFCRDC
jgi:hypothetical protein